MPQYEIMKVSTVKERFYIEAPNEKEAVEAVEDRDADDEDWNLDYTFIRGCKFEEKVYESVLGSSFTIGSRHSDEEFREYVEEEDAD